VRRQLRTVKHPGILNDVLFKIVFATEAGKPILQALLNALLDLNGPQKIVSLELINPISEKEYIDEKGPILDLKARDNSGLPIQHRSSAQSGSGRLYPALHLLHFQILQRTDSARRVL